jgi:hypothetical protein
VILYTLDSSDPIDGCAVYTEPFTILTTKTIRTVALDNTFTKIVPGDPLEVVILPTVTVATPGGGTLTVNPPEGAYDSNNMATVTAMPAPGWDFLEWRGDAQGTNPTTSVSMTQNRCVEAIFGTLVNVTSVGGGSVLRQPESSVLPYGTPVHLTALPNAGRYFVAWGSAASGNLNPLSYVVNAPTQTISTLFAALPVGQHTLSTINEGGGSILVSPAAARYTNNAKVTLTAIPASGQSFIGWTGGLASTSNPITITLTQSLSVTSVFTRFPHMVLERCPGGSSVDAFRMTLSGPPDTRYAIHSSSNLVDWSLTSILTNRYGTIEFQDPISPAPPSSSRLYKVTVVPRAE